MVKKRIALIGLGHIAEHQLKALELAPMWELAAACDLRPERRDLVGSGVPFFASHEELLTEVDSDLVLVSTPTRSHYEIGRMVLANKRNLLLEKPCCEAAGQMNDLVELAQNSGAFFMVAMHAMYAPDVRWLLEYHNEFGLDFEDIVGFESHFFDPLILDGCLHPDARALGHPWLDSGINALSVVGSFIEPASLRLAEGRFTQVAVGPCPFPQVSVDIEFSTAKRHGRGTIETNWALGLNRKTTRLLFADPRRSEVLLDHSNESVVIFRDGREESRHDLRGEQPRLVNHYSGLLADAHQRLGEANSNVPLASALHSLLFNALPETDRNGSAQPTS